MYVWMIDFRVSEHIDALQVAVVVVNIIERCFAVCFTHRQTERAIWIGDITAAKMRAGMLLLLLLKPDMKRVERERIEVPSYDCALCCSCTEAGIHVSLLRLMQHSQQLLQHHLLAMICLICFGHW